MIVHFSASWRVSATDGRNFVIERRNLKKEDTWIVEGYYPSMMIACEALLNKWMANTDEVVSVKELKDLLKNSVDRIVEVTSGFTKKQQAALMADIFDDYEDQPDPMKK